MGSGGRHSRGQEDRFVEPCVESIGEAVETLPRIIRVHRRRILRSHGGRRLRGTLGCSALGALSGSSLGALSGSSLGALAGSSLGCSAFGTLGSTSFGALGSSLSGVARGSIGRGAGCGERGRALHRRGVLGRRVFRGKAADADTLGDAAAEHEGRQPDEQRGFHFAASGQRPASMSSISDTCCRSPILPRCPPWS